MYNNVWTLLIRDWFIVDSAVVRLQAYILDCGRSGLIFVLFVLFISFDPFRSSVSSWLTYLFSTRFIVVCGIPTHCCMQAFVSAVFIDASPPIFLFLAGVYYCIASTIVYQILWSLIVVSSIRVDSTASVILVVLLHPLLGGLLCHCLHIVASSWLSHLLCSDGLFVTIIIAPIDCRVSLYVHRHVVTTGFMYEYIPLLRQLICGVLPLIIAFPPTTG